MTQQLNEPYLKALQLKEQEQERQRKLANDLAIAQTRFYNAASSLLEKTESFLTSDNVSTLFSEAIRELKIDIANHIKNKTK